MDHFEPKEDYITAFNNRMQQRPYQFRVLKEGHVAGADWEIGLFVDGGHQVGHGRHAKKRAAEHLAARDGLRWLDEQTLWRTKHVRRIHQTQNQHAELALLQAIEQNRRALPNWLASVHRRAILEHPSVNMIVETHDLGPLFLLVKSSRAEQLRFMLKGERTRMIGVIIVQRQGTQEELYDRFLTVAGYLRQDIRERHSRT